MPAPCRDGALLGIVLAMLVLVVSCASAPGPLPAQTPDDVATSNRIYAALNADPIYYFRHVNVQVDDGVANLSGYVWSTDALYRARQIARGVPGIARVVSNQLELEREGRDNGIAR